MKNTVEVDLDDEYTLVKIGRVQAMLSFSSRTSVYARLRTDSNFPKPVALGGGRIAWRLSEIRRYIAALPRAELSGLSGPELRAQMSKAGAA